MRDWLSVISQGKLVRVVDETIFLIAVTGGICLQFQGRSNLGQLLRDVDRSACNICDDSLKDKSIGRRSLGSGNHDDRGRYKARREAGILCIPA